jgi:predicted nucleotidyltransferase
MARSFEDYRSLLKERLPELKERWHVHSLELFGSRVRNEARPDSDLDVLVTFDVTPSLFRFIALENYLTDSLGVKVDLVMRSALKPRIGQRILAEAVPV